MSAFDAGRPSRGRRGDAAGPSDASAAARGGEAFARLLDTSRARTSDRLSGRGVAWPAGPRSAQTSVRDDARTGEGRRSDGPPVRLRFGESDAAAGPADPGPVQVGPIRAGVGPDPSAGSFEGDAASLGAKTARTTALAGNAALAARMVDEIVRAVDAARVAGRCQIDVHFDLGGLGAGRVRVREGERGLDLRLELEGARARELAAAGLDELRRGLEARGLELTSLELTGAVRPRPDPPAEAPSGQGEPGDPRGQGRGGGEGGGSGRDPEDPGDPTSDDATEEPSA